LTDTANFSHFDQTAANNYALRQTAAGLTNINAATGQSVNLRVNNGDPVIQVNGTGVGFHNVTPVAQQAQTVDLKQALVNYGLISSTSGNTPLNLGTGTVTGNGSGLTNLNAGNFSSGTLAVGRGGTGQTTLGGTNRLLFTPTTDSVSSIATANNSILSTDLSGVPSWGTTIPSFTTDTITLTTSLVSSIGSTASIGISPDIFGEFVNLDGMLILDNDATIITLIGETTLTGNLNIVTGTITTPNLVTSEFSGKSRDQLVLYSRFFG
jgi:hypothetical protein